MSSEQLKHFRNILISWRQDLIAESQQTVAQVKTEATYLPDTNDQATQEEELTLALSVHDRERDLIHAIDLALKRLTNGEYGYCTETGEIIGLRRLEACPVATLCLEAQERAERRAQQFPGQRRIAASQMPRGGRMRRRTDR